MWSPNTTYQALTPITLLQHLVFCAAPVEAGACDGAVGWGTVLQVEGRRFNSQWCHCNFQWHNPSGRTRALGLTQLLTEVSTRNISRGKRGQCIGLTTLTPSCVECLAIWEPQPPGTSGPVQACNELLYLLPLEADSQCGSLALGTTIHILLNTPYTVEKQCPQSVFRIPAAVVRSDVLIMVLLRIQVRIQLRNVCRV